ncbi:MAG TPA: hypothetical protein H9694_08365 [Firmicutes bacterium]|nr:hypothetical protein [Bacillota bacterium]
MERFKDFISRHKWLCLLLVIAILLAAAAVAAGIYFTARPGAGRPAQTALQEASEQDLQTLQEAGALQGVQDRTLGAGTTVRLRDLVAADGEVITKVEVDDSGVNYDTAGEYQAVYTLSFNGDALNRLLQERGLSLLMDTDADVIRVQVTVTITVTGGQTAPGTTSSATTSQTEAGSTEPSSTQAESQTPPTTSSASRGPDGSSPDAGTIHATQPTTTAHQHNWQAHMVWVPDIVTVVDEPERTVQGARLYTQNADGSWTSNGETYWFEDGFTLDDLKAIIKDKVKNEGYIGSYLNVKKTIPAVTHTEDHGSYQVDYYYCSCGATKR